MRFLRFVLFLLGAVAFLIAVVAVAAEVVAFASDGRIAAKSMGLVWREHHLLSLQLLQVGIERKLGLDPLWQQGIQPLLAWPPIAVAALFFGAGLALILLARLFRRRH